MKIIELDPTTLALMKRRRKKCFLCKFIYADVVKNGHLTRYPETPSGKSVFPIKGKVAHIELEKEAAK